MEVGQAFYVKKMKENKIKCRLLYINSEVTNHRQKNNIENNATNS